MWNALFTPLFKGFSERVAGSEKASRFFYTFIYGLYHGVNLDFGSILWTHLIQSTFSSKRHTKISCARFGSVIVKRIFDHYLVPWLEDSIIVVIPILKTYLFMMSDPTKFSFVGSIPRVMLEMVPQDNAILNVYHKQSSSGVRPIIEEF